MQLSNQVTVEKMKYHPNFFFHNRFKLKGISLSPSSPLVNQILVAYTLGHGNLTTKYT